MLVRVHAPRTRQRGAAALAVTLALFVVVAFIAAYANRHHVLEQRSSADQYRASQAFEAADAGVEWAIALLNEPRTIDAHCTPSPDATTSFRERHLRADTPQGTFSPITWSQAGSPMPLRAACIANGSGWECACPIAGAADAPATDPSQPLPGFSIAFEAAPHAGVVRVRSSGCVGRGNPCASTDGSGSEASVVVQADLGLLPGLAMLPAAPLTVRGDVRAAGAALGLHHTDPASGGFAVHAGGLVDAPSARIATVAGASAAGSIVEGDAMLTAQSPERLFASLFGLGKALWQQHPAVRRLPCESDCGASLHEALRAITSNRLVWIDGDARIEGPVSIGSASQPVVIVATGALEFEGPASVYGLVYAARIAWHRGAGGTGLVRGAVISESSYEGDAAPDLVYDTAVLRSLQTRTGSFARIPGSWKDF